MPSFSIALTGLEADSTALNTIGNNLANLNTTAFKKQDTTFEDLFYQQIGNNGSGEQLQSGAGTRVSGTASDFAQGSLATTNSSTDMALNGNGFFVVQSGAVQSLTRAGNFQLDKSGNLITANGENVMGFAATNGVVSSTGNLTALALPVNGNTTAKPTSNFSVSGNLNAAALSTDAPFTTSVTMYDSLGLGHVATFSFSKSTTANQWNYAITLPPGEQASGATNTNTTGALTFNANGVLTSPSSNVSGIKFTGLSDSATDMTLDWNLFNANGSSTIAQSAAASTATASSQDGYAAGVYQNFSVDSAGLITASFSNGKTQELGQLAIATVSDAEALTRVGGNNYQVSQASGQASFAGAGVGNRGTIEGDALEQSNVDISTEFSDLIVAQRAFEANSKTLTTYDSVTQEAIAMIR